MPRNLYSAAKITEQYYSAYLRTASNLEEKKGKTNDKK